MLHSLECQAHANRELRCHRRFSRISHCLAVPVLFNLQQNRGRIMASLKKRDGSSVAPAILSRFIESFSGKVFYPDTPAYHAARVIWNRRISKSPGLIVQCASSGEIAQAVRFARENDVAVAVKGGGHNVAGYALCDDGLVIDLSPMKQVIVDQDTPTVTVQGGALLEDLDRATHRFGLAVPTGVVSKVGVAGLTLGGGCGWLSRRYGLACDSLL